MDLTKLAQGVNSTKSILKKKRNYFQFTFLMQEAKLEIECSFEELDQPLNKYYEPKYKRRLNGNNTTN